MEYPAERRSYVNPWSNAMAFWGEYWVKTAWGGIKEGSGKKKMFCFALVFIKSNITRVMYIQNQPPHIEKGIPGLSWAITLTYWLCIWIFKGKINIY